MPNYVQLGQGLRDLGQSLSAGYDFLNQQKQLDISQQNANTNSGQLKLDQDQNAEVMRQQRNKESSRALASVFQQAVDSGESNYHDFFTKNKGALDTALNAYGTSNSRAREALAGNKLTGVLGQDGKFDIMTVGSDGAAAPLAIDGQPVRLDGEEIYHLGATEMASNGYSEVISSLKALEAAKPSMPAEEYTQKRSSYVSKLDALQEAADAHGIDTRGISENHDAIGAKHASIDSRGTKPIPANIAAPTPAAPTSLGDKLVSQFFPTSVGAKPAAPTATEDSPSLTDRISSNVSTAIGKYDASREDALMADPSTPGTVRLGAQLARGAKINKTLHEIPYAAGKAVVQHADAAIENVVGEVKKGVSNVLYGAGVSAEPTRTVAPSAKPVATETFIRQESKAPAQKPDDVIEKTRTQFASNPPRNEVQATAVVKRSINALNPGPQLKKSGSDIRDAYHYASAMTIMGLAPDKDVIGNLMDGDTPNGRNMTTWKEENDMARARAQNEVQWAHIAAANAATEAKLRGDSLEHRRFAEQKRSRDLQERRQIIEEFKTSADTAAEASVPGGMKNRADFVKNLSALTQTTAMKMSSQLAMVGYDVNALQDSLVTNPVYAQMLANYVRSDAKTVRHNGKLFKLGNDDRYSAMVFLAKVGSTIDPEQFEHRMAEAIYMDEFKKEAVKNPNPDKQKLVESAYTQARSYLDQSKNLNLSGQPYEQ